MEEKKISNELSDDELQDVTGGNTYYHFEGGSVTVYHVGDYVGLVNRRCAGCGANIVVGHLIRFNPNNKIDFVAECCGHQSVIAPTDIHCKF